MQYSVMLLAVSPPPYDTIVFHVAPAEPAAGSVALCATRTLQTHCTVGPVPPFVILKVSSPPPCTAFMFSVPRTVPPAAFDALATIVLAVLDSAIRPPGQTH